LVVATGTVSAVTRIVSGRYGGRRLDAPDGRATRPSSDRVREALFSALDTRVDLDGARFADLYAGSGAVGLEAVSRGAAHALLVEADQRAARVLRQNIAGLGVAAAVRLTVDRVERVLAGRPAAPYDVVFADPPYAVPDSEVTGMLAALVDGGWLADEATVVVERSKRGPVLAWVPGITPDGVRHYGETALWYGRRS
jgi:16S rRNA (guanine(966)-N(2))-methyltransferase RsmD